MVTFEKLLKIIQDGSKTDYQKAADLHSLLIEGASAAPAPREQKKRGPKPKPKVADLPEGAAGVGGMFGAEPQE